MDAAGVIAYYVMNGDQQLTAESAGNTTYFLYGRGPIGEKTSEWNFSLPDGTNTPRQLSDVTGDITLSARYTPWGNSLELHGTGNFSFGYLGGVLDATTGLIYVGNGQYYDPTTGRFLTRSVNPNSTNPYVPWNPIGAIVGPMGLIALVFGRRKKGSKVGTFLVLALVMVSVGMTLTGCGPAPTPSQSPNIPPASQTPIPSQTPNPTQTPIQTPTQTQAPTNTPAVPTCTLTIGEGVHATTKPYGGNEVMTLYNKMKDYHGARGWWQKHPNQARYKFTFEVFIGLMIVHEGAGNDVYENLTAEVTAQQLYVGGWVSAYCSIGQCSQNAAANQWGAQSQSIGGILDTYVRANRDISEFSSYKGNQNEEIEIAWGMGNKALHPSSLNLDKDNALSVYGCYEDAWVIKINKAALDPSNEMKRFADTEYRDGNPRSIYFFTGRKNGAAVYASTNQQNCWKNNKNCYEVPNPRILNNPASGNFGDN
jgi:RHS repeat-associated protein